MTGVPTEEVGGSGPVKVTVSDPATGKVLGESIVDNDYVLIVNGTCHVSSTQVTANTHTLVIKGRRSILPEHSR